MPNFLRSGLAMVLAPSELAAPAPMPVLDLVHLSRQTLGDTELECELLSSFEQQAGLILGRLNAGKSTALGLMADLAHTLKGSARAIGALGVAQKAGDYETALRNGASNDVLERMKYELFGEVAKACEVISGLLADR